MPRSIPLVTISCALLATALAWAPAARAQDDDAARLFEEGVALREAGDAQGAVDRLRRAHSLDPGDRTAYNLAAALVDRGDLVEAQRILQRVVARHRDLLIADAARALLAQIAPRIAEVRLRIARPAQGQLLFVDGSRTDPGPEGVREISFDPGRHRIEVRDRHGVVLARREVDLREGQRSTIVLHPVAPPHGQAQTESNERLDALVTASRREERDDPWAWVGLGAGLAVAVAIGVTVAAFALGGQGPGTPATGDLPPVIVRGRDG